MAGKNNKTIFDNNTFQFLYAAPYYSEATSEFDFGSPYNQVRLVQVYGAKPSLAGNFSFEGGLEYQAKNKWRTQIRIGTFRDQDDIYYGFQNMTINGSADQNNVDKQSPELLDDFIRINRWYSKLDANFSYDLPIKTIIKSFVYAGYSHKLQFFSSYSSELTRNANQYINSESDRQVKDYYNTKVLQDKLYQEFSNDGFNHYLSLGIGARYFSTDIRFEWLTAIGQNNENYYLGQQIFNLKLSYNIISKGLF